MPNNTQLRGTSFLATATGTTSASAQIAIVPGTTYYITDITASTDLAGGTAVLFAGPATGTTVFWQVRVGSTDAYEENFQTPLKVFLPSGTITFLVNGTSYTSANISGYAI